jgi:catechol 2,3-dioxygenase-like lactoylglutathione lyase family enzyme
MKAKFDSVVFATRRLAEVRAFYENVLGLAVAKIECGAEDANDRYVNFKVEGGLLGFETGLEMQSARVVLRVPDLRAELERLSVAGVRPSSSGARWAIVRDPEGREIILE